LWDKDLVGNLWSSISAQTGQKGRQEGILRNILRAPLSESLERHFMKTKAWVQDELEYLELGDPRRNQRISQLVSDLADHPQASVPEACGSWAATKAAYRFWDNDHVEAQSIRDAHQQKTFQRLLDQDSLLDQDTILIVQDTTNLDFTTQPNNKKGMGHLDHRSQLGLKQHSALAVSTDGVPQGIVYQELWARDPATYGKKHQRRHKVTADKESQRWIRTVEALQQDLSTTMRTKKLVFVADRESDLYDYLSMERPGNVELLIRVAQTRRCVSHEARYLLAAVQASPVAGTVRVNIQPSGNRSAREAILTLRYQKLSLKPPRNGISAGRKTEVCGWVILAEEVEPPQGETAIVWVLWTSLLVECFQDAVLCLEYYRLRWLVERYHFVLKSGCRIEQLQLETPERIERAVATFNLVAWRLLWLTYEARRCPDKSCEGILETHEWEALLIHHHRQQRQSLSLPLAPPTLAQAVAWIAQLGGFRGSEGRRCSVVSRRWWRGLRHLHDLAWMWRLCRDSVLAQHSADPSGSLDLPDLNPLVGKG